MSNVVLFWMFLWKTWEYLSETSNGPTWWMLRGQEDHLWIRDQPEWPVSPVWLQPPCISRNSTGRGKDREVSRFDRSYPLLLFLASNICQKDKKKTQFVLRNLYTTNANVGITRSKVCFFFFFHYPASNRAPSSHGWNGLIGHTWGMKNIVLFYGRRAILRDHGCKL